MKVENISKSLLDGGGDDIPPQVRFIISTCEVANMWTTWQEEHHDEPKAWFCSGLFDYWWDEELSEPHWGQVFYTNLETGEFRGVPEHRHFCYQQGAIVGYKLREEFKDE